MKMKTIEVYKSGKKKKKKKEKESGLNFKK
jgi:hypothetical protein